MLITMNSRKSIINAVNRVWEKLTSLSLHYVGRIQRIFDRVRNRPVWTIRRPDFDEMVASFPYYRGRWRYMSVALKEARSIIKRHDVQSALELGMGFRTILLGADGMDVRARSLQDSRASLIVHDATDSPWPIDDKAYDLFLALQVFEHLGASQPEAFREVRRIACNAIISVPIDWDMQNPNDCHHMISEDRALSWFLPVKPTRIVEGNGGKRRRLIFVFEDLPD